MALHHCLAVKIFTAVARPTGDKQNLTAYLSKSDVLIRGIFSYFLDCLHLWTDAR